MTTPPPTMTGRPRRAGSSRCATEAKNASTSACRMTVPGADTNVCSYRNAPARWQAAQPARPQASSGRRAQVQVAHGSWAAARDGVRHAGGELQPDPAGARSVRSPTASASSPAST